MYVQEEASCQVSSQVYVYSNRMPGPDEQGQSRLVLVPARN